MSELLPCHSCGSPVAWCAKRVCCSNRDCWMFNVTVTPEEWSRRTPAPKVDPDSERDSYFARFERAVLDMVPLLGMTTEEANAYLLQKDWIERFPELIRSKMNAYTPAPKAGQEIARCERCEEEHLVAPGAQRDCPTCLRPRKFSPAPKVDMGPCRPLDGGGGWCAEHDAKLRLAEIYFCDKTEDPTKALLSSTPPDPSSAAVEKARVDNVIIGAQSVVQGENEGHHKNAKAQYIRTLRTALDNYAALEKKP